MQDISFFFFFFTERSCFHWSGSACANAISQYSLAIFLFGYIHLRGLHKATWNGKIRACVSFMELLFMFSRKKIVNSIKLGLTLAIKWNVFMEAAASAAVKAFCLFLKAGPESACSSGVLSSSWPCPACWCTVWSGGCMRLQDSWPVSSVRWSWQLSPSCISWLPQHTWWGFPSETEVELSPDPPHSRLADSHRLLRCCQCTRWKRSWCWEHGASQAVHQGLPHPHTYELEWRFEWRMCLFFPLGLSGTLTVTDIIQVKLNWVHLAAFIWLLQTHSNNVICVIPDPVTASCVVGVCLFATKDVIGYIFTADKWVLLF